MDKIKRDQTNGTLASRTVIVRDYEEMSRRSAQILAQVVAQKPDALLCLAAGQTAIRTYELLAEWQQAGKVDFGAARFVALDEQGMSVDALSKRTNGWIWTMSATTAPPSWIDTFTIRCGFGSSNRRVLTCMRRTCRRNAGGLTAQSSRAAVSTASCWGWA